MKKYIFWLLPALVCVPLAAQEATPQDTTTRHETLGEAVVSGWTGNTMLRHTPVPVTSISSGDLAFQNATNIIDALSHQPGVSQITTGGAISKPAIRGLGYNRIVIVNDGIRQEGQQWGDEHGIEIDPQTVWSAEIIKGPASLLYGSDAMSGVIIFHHAPVNMPGSITASMSNEYQTNNGLIGNSVYNAGHVGSFVWDVRLSHKMAHSYRNRSDGYVFNSGFNEKSASGMVGVNRNWGYSHLRFGTYILNPGLVEGERNPDGSFVKPEDFNDRAYRLALPFQNVLHSKLVSETSVALGGGNLNATLGYQRNTRKEFEESADECGLHFLLQTVNYDLHYRTAEFSGWKFLSGVGGMFQKSDNLGTEFLIPAYRLFDFGLFATLQKSFGPVFLSGGVRYDHRDLSSDALTDEGEDRFKAFTRAFNGFSGSVGLTYSPVEKFSLKANFSTGFRAPNISELASNGVHEGTERYELGSSSLRSEHSYQFDLGAEYYSDRLTASLSLFANRINSFIFSERSPGSEVIDDHDVFRFTQGDAFLYGGEADIDWTIIRGLSLDNSFSYVCGQLANPGTPGQRWLPLMPAPRFKTELRYDFRFSSKVFKNTFAQISQETTFAQNRFYAAYGTETATPSYTLLDASIGTDICLKGKKLVSVMICGNNLTDKVYQSHLSRLKYVGVYNMGRNFGFKLLWNLEWGV